MQNYISSEEFDLMSEEEIDVLDWDYFHTQLEDIRLEQYFLEKEAMETDYQYCK